MSKEILKSFYQIFNKDSCMSTSPEIEYIKGKLITTEEAEKIEDDLFRKVDSLFDRKTNTGVTMDRKTVDYLLESIALIATENEQQGFINGYIFSERLREETR